MRSVSQAMTDAWKNQLKAGAIRPVVRVTVQKAHMQRFDYDTALAPGGDFDHQPHRTGTFTSMVFGSGGGLRELRNIKTVTWNRSVEQDAATCTIVMLNSEITPIGEVDNPDEFDQPGYFTYNRGQQTISANRWGYTTDTGWQDVLVPDRVIRTFEGYGCDMTVPAAQDPNLVQSGVWLIDKVTYTHDGEITIECRDLCRMLLDQISFPPIIPYADYPLSWTPITTAQVDGRTATGGSWVRPTGTAASSNNSYIGLGLQDPPYATYVGPQGNFNGHDASYALGGNDGRYWESTGQTTPQSKVWWEVALDDKTTPMAGINIDPKGGPYRIYISLENDSGWVGKKKIPYGITTEGVDLKAGIPFVMSVIADKGLPFDVILPRKYKNIKRIRLTFSHLWDTKIGNYPFRAALKDIKIYTAANVADLGFGTGTNTEVVGNYSDYTSIVKWACAWGGFFWPPAGTKQDFWRIGPNGLQQTVSYTNGDDPALPRGRVWGDFMTSGTTGVAPLTSDLFDKKPLMDMINYVRDALGFVFFIDETGGVIWRMPNKWNLGNWLSPEDLSPRGRTRTSQFITIDETETLITYSTTLDSRNVRDRIFVANNTGKWGVVIKGFSPYLVGLRRIAGWTDQHFTTKDNPRVVADMIASEAMYTYRVGKVRIPGYPAIQIDDQVRIYERVTNETYYHYVAGITSTIDMDTGEWFYDLDTHWLGEDPSKHWVVDKSNQLAQVTQNYLNQVGQ